MANWGGGFLSFRRLVRDHRDLWIETNKSMLLGFQLHSIITPMELKLRLGDSRMINKFNDTIHTSFIKHDIYQKIHYIHNRGIYALPTHL